ncbi:MAG: HDOD domain-containing protein [Chitinispirillaceae bacterium]|nr:HDOD domain-containing protein [Chitinispirillaceae bacterium]
MAEAILFVDDDRMVLNALERTFFETDYRTFFALNAHDAFTLLESEKTDMVVSDIRMWPVSGYDFLKEVRARYPAIIRLVLSAYGDRQMMTKVICEGIAKIFILKPWDNRTFTGQIDHLFTMYRSLADLQSSGIISAEKQLPVLPELYIRMVRMIEEERSLKEIAALIETDPSCTVNVLKLVNSAFYGLTVGSVHQALVYLGVDCIKDIVLVSELFKAAAGLPPEDARVQLNRHMVVSSTLLHGLHQRLLAERIPEEYSATGLLADIGRLILLDQRPEIYRSIIERYVKEPARSLTELEMNAVGYSHAQLGALLLDWWNLPAYLVEACLYHHVISFAGRTLPREIIALIHIADCYAWRIAEGVGTMAIDKEAVGRFPITEKELDDHVASIINRADSPNR